MAGRRTPTTAELARIMADAGRRIDAAGRRIDALGRFFEFFPEHRGRELEGLIGGVRIDRGVDRTGVRKGLLVLVPSGETVTMFNPDGFRARVWAP